MRAGSIMARPDRSDRSEPFRECSTGQNLCAEVLEELQPAAALSQPDAVDLHVRQPPVRAAHVRHVAADDHRVAAMGDHDAADVLAEDIQLAVDEAAVGTAESAKACSRPTAWICRRA